MTVQQPSVWSSASPAPAVLRAGLILDILVAAKGRPVTVGELAAETGMPRSSVVNIAMAMIQLGLVNQMTTGMVLGRRLAELGAAYLDALNVVQMFTERCRSLGDALEETAQLAVLDGLEVVDVGRFDGPTPVPVNSRIGRRLPAYGTALGKVLLAGMPAVDVREALRAAAPLRAMTPKMKTSIKAIMAELDLTRERGYGINDEETTEGIYGIAMRVRDQPDGVGPYAVSISMLKARANPARIARAMEVLDELANLLSAPRDLDAPVDP